MRHRLALALLLAPLFAAAPAAADDDPLAGYNAGSFYLRDPNDWFVIFPKGRLQIDWYNFLNRGDPPAGVDPNAAKDPRPRDTLFIRRARAELVGTFARHYEFSIAGEFATVPSVGAYGTLTDDFINVNYTPWLQLQVGQYDAPFTMENRTSDKVFDFMERSLAVRDLGAPANKEAGAMLWGYAPNKLVYYSVGAFDGDGQFFKNLDNKPALIARAFVAPLAPLARDRKWMEQMWVGGSFWYQTATNLGGAAAPSTSAGTQADLLGMSTQGAFGFFSSSYGNKDIRGNTIGRSHLTPDNEIVKWALEANLPVHRYGLRFELVHVSEDLARYDDNANPMTGVVTRSAPLTGGHLAGTGWYLEAFAWILGDQETVGAPGLEPNPTRKKFVPANQPKVSVMLAGKVERLAFDVTGAPGMTSPWINDQAAGHYAVDVVEFGVNAWLTKHVRLTANYLANFIGGFDNQGLDKKAGIAAGFSPNFAGNFYFGRVEHELLFRLAVGL